MKNKAIFELSMSSLQALYKWCHLRWSIISLTVTCRPVTTRNVDNETRRCCCIASVHDIRVSGPFLYAVQVDDQALNCTRDLRGAPQTKSQTAGSFLIWELLILGSDTYSDPHSEWQEGSKQLWEDENFSNHSNNNIFVLQLNIIWLKWVCGFMMTRSYTQLIFLFSF